MGQAKVITGAGTRVACGVNHTGNGATYHAKHTGLDKTVTFTGQHYGRESPLGPDCMARILPVIEIVS